MKSEIHPTALIAPTVRLGPGCRVGPYVVIEDEVELGAECRIAAHAVVKRFTRMGDGNQVFEGAVLGGIPQDVKYDGADSGLSIGNANVFREGVTVNRSTAPGARTVLGDGNLLMVHAHVAHECELGDRVVMANCVALAGHVSIGDGAFLSGGVVVHQFCRIGRLAMVGGNAKVVQDVLPFCLVDGVPARLRGVNAVGLRRAGMSASRLGRLKQAVRALASSGKLAERLHEVEQLDSPECAELVKFVRESERGFVARPSSP